MQTVRRGRIDQGSLADMVLGLRRVLGELEATYGEVVLFALFQREHPLKIWDIVISAPWLRSGDAQSLKKVCFVVQSHLDKKEMHRLSHVEILNADDHPVSFLRERYNVQDGDPEEAVDCEELSDTLPFVVNRAYLFRCLKE